VTKEKTQPLTKEEAKLKRERSQHERTLRFSKKRKDEMSPEEREALASMTNRERKQAYYAKKKDKLTSPKKKKTEQEPLSFKGRSALRAAPKRTLRKGQFIREQDIQKPKKGPDEGMRLNKFLANAGVAARRKADELIKAGLIKVNGEVVMEMGYKLHPDDEVTYKGKKVKPARFVYLLLNKPKDYLTTVTDDRDRRTVMDLVAKATQERVYPVGRLDRHTTGLLLITNDGDLAMDLAHPSRGVQKVYEVTLDKAVEKHDMEAIAEGLELEDGKAMVDEIAWPDPHRKNVVGISLHIGKNRIVRRIFEHLGYQVTKLDRTVYAGLTKKDLPRGRWRYLTPREVVQLKHLGKK